MNRLDKTQIMLNILAFLVLMFSPGGQGSFWGFITFNIISGIVLTEIILSRDRTAMWVWITKTVTYVFLSIKFAHNMGQIKIEYIFMVLLSIGSLMISRKIFKKRIIALWGQNLAYLIGGYLYISAIINSPQGYGVWHIIFWIINLVSYSLLIQQIYKENKPKINLTIPVFATIVCFIYIMIIFVLSIL